MEHSRDIYLWNKTAPPNLKEHFRTEVWDEARNAAGRRQAMKRPRMMLGTGWGWWYSKALAESGKFASAGFC